MKRTIATEPGEVFVYDIPADGGAPSFRSTLFTRSDLVAIVEACVSPGAPWFVVGEADAPGTVRVHFLGRMPFADLLELRAAIEYIAPVWLLVTVSDAISELA